MIYMGVCKKNAVNGGRRDRKPAVLIYIRSLFHAAVYQYLFPAGFKQGA